MRHLEQLMAQLLDGVILLDPTGVILSVNGAALAMHGVREAADLGATAEEYAERFTMWSEDHSPLKRREYPLFRLLAGEALPDMVVEVAPAGDNEARWVHQVRDVTMDVDDGEPDFLALVLSDVSKRYDAEARFKAMFQANPAPALVVRSRDLRVVQANPGFLSLTQFTAEQLVGRTLFGLDLLGGEAKAPAIRQSIEAGEVVPQTDAELLVADGGRRLVVFAGQPIDVTDDDALLLTFADLEPRRQAEQALAASEQHLQAVFDMAPVAMAITRGDDGRITGINAAFRELTGHDADALDHRMDQLGLWNDVDERAAAEAAIKQQGSVRGVTAKLSSKSGSPVECLISAETIHVHHAPCVLWVFQDVTDRRRSEAQLGEAIDEVLRDASWLSRSILDKLATLRRPASHSVPVDLTSREREILELICDDLDDATIADRLAISRNTVRNHVARLYAKIGTNRRSGAVIWGRERGMGRKRE
jgi:PAS domain S-box-containing protein